MMGLLVCGYFVGVFSKDFVKYVFGFDLLVVLVFDAYFNDGLFG